MRSKVSHLLSSFKGKRVFITGHTGFKGSWLSLWLSSVGSIVKGFSLAAHGDHQIYNQIPATDYCESFIGDIRDDHVLKREIIKFDPDFIFHLAAQPLVSHGYSDPVDTYSTNVLGTVNLLNTLRYANNECVVIVITTDKVYRNESGVELGEGEELGGIDPYSTSKVCCEYIVNSFRDSYFPISNINEHGITIATARSGNVIGGGDWSVNRIMPDIIRALENQKPILVRNPYSIRPWQHVLDPLYGYISLAFALRSNPALSGAWNFGPDEQCCKNVEYIVENAIRFWGSGNYTIDKSEAKFHETETLILDSTKAKSLINWNTTLNIDQSIKLAIDWYKGFFQNVNVHTLIQNDIDYFKNL